MDASDTYEKILDAATRVVNKIGFAKTTIEAIAEEAMLSKGGVFYYFKTKDDCLLAILDRIFERILIDARANYAQLPPGPGRMLKAYITAWIKWNLPPRNVQIKGLLDNDALRERLIDWRVQHYELVLDGQIPELVVQKVLLICSGLWTTPLLARATMEELRAFFEVMQGEMLAMIDDAALDMPGNEERSWA